MKLQTAIVEDQKPDAERLEQLLKKAFGEEEILCRRFVCGDDFLKEFPGEGYQVVFLDICMEGTNGIETARQLRAADPELEVRIARQTVHLPLKKIHYAMAQNHFVKVVTDDGECRATANFTQVQEQLMTQPDFLMCNRGIIFNLPYLFSGVEAYHEAMDDPEVTDPIFKTTSKAGLETVAWLDAGTRNFYTIKTPINQPSDLKGLKIRVQQSPTNVEMMRLLGGTATPMGFGDVYTALQAGILDGAENNELALTDNGHGDICKYYSYDMHQMVPDLLVANYAFLNGLSDEERAIFEEGFQIVKSTEQDAWEDAVAEAKDKAENEQHVNFIYPDTAPFQEAMAPLHDSVLAANPELQPIYDRIQQHNAAHTAD